jgi:hypothetical protein
LNLQATESANDLGATPTGSTGTAVTRWQSAGIAGDLSDARLRTSLEMKEVANREIKAALAKDWQVTDGRTSVRTIIRDCIVRDSVMSIF